MVENNAVGGAVLNSISNDLGYEAVFSKQIELLGRAGDVLYAVSSSGNSPNILRAVEAARRARATLDRSHTTCTNPSRSRKSIKITPP